MKKLFFFLLSISILASCVKQEFDQPPVNTNTVDFNSNTTIAALKKLHTLGALELISDDLIIAGTVTGDDESGNIYKTIVIQDATAGIEVKINATGLYNDFKIGDKVYVKCNGLTLGDYNGIIQLGGGTYDNNGTPALAGIEKVLIPAYVFNGGVGAVITPKVVKVSELTNDMVSTLIQIDNAEFAAGNFAVGYADGAKKLTLNRTVNVCNNGGSIILRTSGFSNFANDLTPNGNGAIVGIYTIFGTTKQMVIRTPADVNFPNTRCDGSSGGGGGGTVTGDPISIGEVKALYTGTATKITANKVISGVVISDLDNGNWPTKNMVVQGSDGKGIAIRFDANHSYKLGELVQIEVGDKDLTEYNGLLQISATVANSKSTGAGTLPTPKKLTIAQLLADFENNESTLVTIDNCSNSASKYSGNVTLDDKTGKITLYTASLASFANDVPISNVINVTGVVGQFNTTNQLLIRNLSDVTKGTGGGGGTGGTVTPMTIGDLRALYTGTTGSAPADKSIKGVVISDIDGKNGSLLNMVVQGADGKGIAIRFSGNHNVTLGKAVEVNISGVELSEYNGLLQLNKVPVANIKVEGDGTLPAPKEMTVADYKVNFESVESTLIKINNATITGGKYFDATRGTTTSSKGTVKLDDGTGMIDIYTTVSAVFNGDTPPATTVSVTGIASEFTATGATAKGLQLLLRNASDVK